MITKTDDLLEISLVSGKIVCPLFKDNEANDLRETERTKRLKDPLGRFFFVR